jgi:splicing factor 1
MVTMHSLLSVPPLSDTQRRGADLFEFHCSQRLEEENFESVNRVFKTDANIRPSTAYQQKRPPRLSHKVYIPVKEYPQVRLFVIIWTPSKAPS